MHKLIRSLTIFAVLLIPYIALSQTATILPNGMTQYTDASGRPLANGKVYYYIPSTSTFKTTWQDADRSKSNTNPVQLDAAGRALIYGYGTYRQVVHNSLGVPQWDQLTASTGGSSGGGTSVGDALAVGTILPYSGVSAPSGYAFAYGQAVSRSTYATLLTNITISTTSGGCVSASPNIGGFSSTEQVRVGAPIEASCLTPGATVKSIINGTTIEASSNANSTTTTTVRIFPWGNGDGSTTFNAPDLRARVPTGRDNMGGSARVGTTGLSYLGGTLGLPSVFSQANTTRQVLISGSGATYNTPVGTTRITVEMVGGAGGGGAVATNSGAAGTATIFNSIEAAPGAGGAAAGGAGGAGGSGGAGSASLRIAGGSGNGGNTTAANTLSVGGGNSCYGGAAGGRAGSAGTGVAAAANSGSGGSGGAASNTSNGGGGGAGECVLFSITSPAASYTYTVGGGGAGGTAGTQAGGAGGTGLIIVTEEYGVSTPLSAAIGGAGEPENSITNFIIKMESNAGSNVVTDLGGMTGSVACSGGILCSANTISLSASGLSTTKTVRASGGASDCTLIFTNGLLTGGTC